MAGTSYSRRVVRPRWIVTTGVRAKRAATTVPSVTSSTPRPPARPGSMPMNRLMRAPPARATRARGAPRPRVSEVTQFRARWPRRRASPVLARLARPRPDARRHVAQDMGKERRAPRQHVAERARHLFVGHDRVAVLAAVVGRMLGGRHREPERAAAPGDVGRVAAAPRPLGQLDGALVAPDGLSHPRLRSANSTALRIQVRQAASQSTNREPLAR